MHKEFQNLAKKEDPKDASEKLRSIIQISNKLSAFEDRLNLALDDYSGVVRNTKFVKQTAGGSGISDEELVDKPIYGTTYRIKEPLSGVALEIWRGVPEKDEKPKCKSNYCCSLCNERDKPTLLPKEKPPLKRGAAQETLELINIMRAEVLITKAEIKRCLERTKSFISNITSLLTISTNLSLDLSLFHTSIRQTEILSKVEKILEQSEKDRKITEKATKVIELLSLLFASFVIGEISSNFIIWWLQQSWPSPVPNYVYVGGFFLSLMISGILFLAVYLGYLRRKWH